MSNFVDIAPARERLRELCGRAAGRERTALTEDGTTMAVLISPEELADLEDRLALAENRLNELSDAPEPSLTFEEMRTRLNAARTGRTA